MKPQLLASRWPQVLLPRVHLSIEDGVDCFQGSTPNPLATLFADPELAKR